MKKYDSSNKAIGKRLRELRKKHGDSQESLAEKLNIEKADTYGKYERGVTTFPIDYALDLVELYDTDLYYIYTGIRQPSDTKIAMMIEDIPKDKLPYLLHIIKEIADSWKQA